MTEYYDLQQKKCVLRPCGSGQQRVNGQCKDKECGPGETRDGDKCVTKKCSVLGEKMINGKCQVQCTAGQVEKIVNGKKVCTVVTCSNVETYITGVGCRKNCEQHFMHNKLGKCVRYSCPSGFELSSDGQCLAKCQSGQVRQGEKCVTLSCKITEELVGTSCVTKKCESGKRLNSAGKCEEIKCDKYHKVVGNSCVRTGCPPSYELKNLDGTKVCIKSCKSGYVPSKDGKSCEQ